ncbi:MAG TPA: FecR domain-containing protein, partial [Zeimonas sp.]
MIRALALLLGLFAAIGSAVAEDGRALVVAGRVMLERATPGAFSITAVSAGTEIRRGDLIRTGDDGRVQIRFSDGSIVALQPATVFRIDEYRFERDDRRAFFFLLRGALRTLTGVIGKANHDEYRMKTPTATVGVRGTEYVAEQTVCDPLCAPGPRAGLRVAVTQGRIVLLTNAGEVEVGTGQAASAEGPDAPPHPTERGPVLPPISLSAPTERTTGRTSRAGTAGQNRSTPTVKAQSATMGSDGARGNPGAGTADAFDPPVEGERAPTASGGTSSPAAPATSGSVGSSAGDRDRRAQEVLPAIESSANPDASSEMGALVGTWPRFFANEAGLPAPVSPNEKRNRDGALLPVLEQLAPGTPPGDPADDSHATGPGTGGPGTVPGDPIPGDPIPGDPVPGDPVPSDPVPGDPAPGDPVPGDPAPGDPA